MKNIDLYKAILQHNKWVETDDELPEDIVKELEKRVADPEYNDL